MALIVNDRVKETTTTTGTGTITLGGASTGFETFAAGIGNSNTTYYCITLPGSAEFEVGLGTLSGDSSTLARTTVISSSNSDSAVNFSSGTKDVFCTLPASKAIIKDANGALASTTMSGALDLNGNELVLDVDGDTSITADTDDQIDIKIANVDVANLTTANSGDLVIKTAVSDKDFAIKGNDGGSEITALSIDMSAAGAATFNDDVVVGSKLKMPTNTANKILVADGTSFEEVDLSGDATIASGGAMTLANSGVTAASYTATNLTVDAKGRITSASSGAAGASAGFVIAMAVAL
jgi:hypothetical protein|tara:strand:- start:569 stop:1453 length:885 start_codon:yes stop_codon:yes gene_type:complete